MEMLPMTVFEAFPNGLEAWKIGTMAYSTISGNAAANWETINVIADEVQNQTKQTLNAPGIESDTLLYCKPAELPSTSIPTLISDYAVKDPDGRIYSIIEAATGKNFETGELEHIELIVRQTGAIESPEASE